MGVIEDKRFNWQLALDLSSTNSFKKELRRAIIASFVGETSDTTFLYHYLLTEGQNEFHQSGQELKGPPSRSISWKFLLLGIEDPSLLLHKLDLARKEYANLQASLVHARFDDNRPIGSVDDPLSDNATSPWNLLRQDEKLRQEIEQDVTRCMPESPQFREVKTQRRMLDILFIWSKQNEDIGYRQGIHELLAPILLAVEQDAVSDGPDEDVFKICKAEFTEHDSFILFNELMKRTRLFYEHKCLSDTETKFEPPIALISKEIMSEILPKLDPELSKHLSRLQMAPQIFILRWLRLLFGREFPLPEVYRLWDIIFACDTELSLVKLVCTTMILRERWALLQCDHNAALTILMHYPAHTAVTFFEDAAYLSNNFDSKGGAFVIEQRTGRAVNDLTDVHSQKLGKSSLLQRPTTSNTIEAVLSDAARGIASTNERFGFTRAMRGAVTDFKRSVLDAHREFQEQGISSQHANIWRQKYADSQQRNLVLSKLLDGAVQQLWKAQENRSSNNSDEVITLAVAKVHLVQVYLADPTLSLAELSDEESSQSTFDSPNLNKSNEATIHSSHRNKSLNSLGSKLAHESAKEKSNDIAMAPSKTRQPRSTGNRSGHTSMDETPKSKTTQETDNTQKEQEVNDKTQAHNDESLRKPLNESRFAWMLDSSAETPPKAESSNSPGRAFVAANRYLSPNNTLGKSSGAKKHAAKSAFLFGEEERDPLALDELSSQNQAPR